MICCSLSSLLATQQVRDSVTYQGERRYMMESPLNSIWPPDGAPRFDVDSTANWKSYRAAWEIRDNKLFLVSFEAKQGGAPFPIAKLFPDQKLPIFAKWYSGALNIPVDVPQPRNMRFKRIFILNVQRGEVRSITEAREATYELPQ